MKYFLLQSTLLTRSLHVGPCCIVYDQNLARVDRMRSCFQLIFQLQHVSDAHTSLTWLDHYVYFKSAQDSSTK